MGVQIAVTVINTSREQVWRAGYVFQPERERTVKVTTSGLAEIKACQTLSLFEPGFRCDHPRCGFIAKNSGALRFHKKSHEKKAEAGGEAANG